MKTAQALALFDGADFVTPEQIQSLAVSGHRAPAGAGTAGALFRPDGAQRGGDIVLKKLKVPA
jgi:MoxR-like ATPase